MNTPEPKPKLTTSQLINKYAKIAGDVYDEQTAGDYTFVGLFGSFLNEWLENYDTEPEPEPEPVDIDEVIETLND
jgi:hypothetical protein